METDETGWMVGDWDADVSAAVWNEMLLLDPDVRSRSAAVLELLHEDFVEFGSSGRTWTRSVVVAALADDPGEVVEAHDIRASRLGPDAVLLTYELRAPGRTSLRSSVWRRDRDRWWLFFHQGTSRPPAGDAPDL
ncbi:MAG: nuclear transport factor 2 family protein [Kineosporiaceae bacterium]